MERLPHPGYVRKVAGFSIGLFVVGMACLVGGFVLKRLGLPLVADVLDFAFAISAVVMLVLWFSSGETTLCPRCGRRLRADPQRDRDENLCFECPDCDVCWETGITHDM